MNGFPRDDDELSKIHCSPFHIGRRVARNGTEGRQMAILNAAPLLNWGDARWRVRPLAEGEFSIYEDQGGGVEKM